MTGDLMLVIAPIVGLAAYAVTHVAYNWISAGNKLLMGFLYGLLAGWTAQTALTVYALTQVNSDWTDGLARLLVNQFTYLALADLYSHFVNIMIASLRIRVLHELFQSERGLTEQQILAGYNAREIVQSRLHRLTSTDQLRYENGRYFSRPCFMLIIAKFYQLLKLIILGNRQPANGQLTEHAAQEEN